MPIDYVPQAFKIIGTQQKNHTDIPMTDFLVAMKFILSTTYFR